MTKARKVDLLYRRAKGQGSDASSEELRELRKYKVLQGEGDLYVTKANLNAYVDAVDKKGCKISFYDWCINNHKADRRRVGSSDKELSQLNQEQRLSAMLLGWLTWGIAIYWVCQGEMSVGSCAVAGAAVAFVLSRIARRWVMFTLFALPVIIAVLAYR